MMAFYLCALRAASHHLMSFNFLKLFSGRHYRVFLRNCKPVVEKINRIEQEYQALTPEALRAKTDEFRARLAKGETLEGILPEAFAAAKNAARRLCGQELSVCGQPLTWNMVHFDVQLIGGIALSERKIAEMATGEGKTLVATLPLYLHALAGKGAHLVTVNDYLARRDSEWMGHLYNSLGLTVGCIQNQMDSEARKAAYACDITYGTASEFGFDYLRDNGMATRKEDQVQRGHFYCIVDEVDSILVDEARTPLIISGPAQDATEAPYRALKPAIEQLVSLQQKLCNRLVSEAKDVLEKPDHTDAQRREACEKLLQVRLGMPKHRQLTKMMEGGPSRKWLEAFDLEMSSDFNKESRYRIKEALYFVIDEKQHQSDLTELGRNTLAPGRSDAFVIPDLPSIYVEIDKDASLSVEERQKKRAEAEAIFAKTSEDIHVISQLLRAYTLYDRDEQYVVMDGKVMIVDENTGRMMPGRRWSEGLHQAVEAKEGVEIEKESKTYATITIQNYFRMYQRLAGMTGTAETEAGEFYDIYKLNVVVIPTNQPCMRKDANDIIYKTRREKYHAALDNIVELNKRGQPVLVGTTSVDASELLSKMLKRANVPHTVLNAKFHQQEAEIVSRAGQRGAVTIATNMAGRGTDIKLGEGVEALGGLYVLGTERHQSRRIDRQLRGRCARQGDPGMSKFLISLEDDLMRLFAKAGPISRILERSFVEGEPLEHPLLNRSIETAQKRVEQQNYSIRKRLLQYDDVLNRQREVVYGIRNDVLHADDPTEAMMDMIAEELGDRLEVVYPHVKGEPDADALKAFVGWLRLNFPLALEEKDFYGKNAESAKVWLTGLVKEAFFRREQFEEAAALRWLERFVMIRAIDRNWQDHLTEMEDLRNSVGLRGYGQKDPLNEYKSDAYVFFDEMMGRVRNDICAGLFRSATNPEAFQNMISLMARAQHSGPADEAAAPGAAPVKKAEPKLPKIEPVKKELPKVGRNDLCPCGSGKKFKKCCGKDE